MPFDRHPGIRYFKPEEFERRTARDAPLVNWWQFLDPDVVYALDKLRHTYGNPIIISPADGTIGRVGKENFYSDHYCDVDSDPPRLVRALDVMPIVITQNEARAGLAREQAFRISLAAIGAGFNAIGLYPHWKPYPGFHLGIRRGTVTMPASTSLWGNVKTKIAQDITSSEYVTASDALLAWQPKNKLGLET